MNQNYNDIVHRFYEDLKSLFINYLRKNFMMDYDEIMGIYVDVWIDVRENIRLGTVKKGTKWKAYILKMGWNKASKIARKRNRTASIDDDSFNREKFELEYYKDKDEEKSMYDDEGLLGVLASELSYIPDPCNTLLKLYYYEDLSMNEIADTMNYSSARVAITTRGRCMEKLKSRVLTTVRKLGLLN